MNPGLDEQEHQAETTEVVKLIGTVLAMVISATTVNFLMAEFVNKVRDQHSQTATEGLKFFSSYFD